MIIDCISDLHGHYPTLAGGDLLIVAGDLTARDTEEEYKNFFRWLRDQNYEEIVVIAGNHDNYLQKCRCMDDLEDCGEFTYLCDSGTEFEWFETEDTKWGARHLPGNRSLKLKIWGSPWTKTFAGMNPKCKAFTVDTEEALAEKWALIPQDTDILVTHSPSWGMKDGPHAELRYGSTSLLRRINEIDVRNLKLHVCGHIHEGYGVFDMRKCQKQLGDVPTCVFINASHVNERYKPVNKPVRIDL
jgi:Icc-related predicted phosphoesterase